MLQSLPSFDLHIPMTTTNHSLFFLLFAPMFLQLHARESQFFSKFNNHSPIEDELLPTTTTQSQQQDQNFIPQTTDSTGYGLYGHLPPSTTTLSVTNGDDHNNHPTTFPENYNTVAYTTPIHSNMYNYQKQGASDTRVSDYGKYNHVDDMYNTEKQGMSDTRYMENGKYYYDLNSRSSNPRVFGRSSNSRVFDSRDGYNTRGYYGNDDNSYDRYNSNARFQEDQEDVFTP